MAPTRPCLSAVRGGLAPLSRPTPPPSLLLDKLVPIAARFTLPAAESSCYAAAIEYTVELLAFRSSDSSESTTTTAAAGARPLKLTGLVTPPQALRVQCSRATNH